MLAAAIVCSVTAQAANQMTGEVRRGAKLVQRMCAECHSVEGTETPPTNTKAPSFASIAKMPEMSMMLLRERLDFPHPMMPSLLLTNEQKEDITAYLLALRDNKFGTLP